MVPANSEIPRTFGPVITRYSLWRYTREALPNNDRQVSGWNGHCVVFCKYYESLNKWFDWEGKEVPISIWKIRE